jgi:ferredoxin
MKVRVDPDLCVGCGTCVDISPDIFVMVDDVAVTKLTDVPEDLQSECQEAADACGVEAIIVED